MGEKLRAGDRKSPSPSSSVGSRLGQFPNSEACRSQKPARLIISPGIFDTSTARPFKASIVPVIVTFGLDFRTFRFVAFFVLDFFDFFLAAIKASSHAVLRLDNATDKGMEPSSRNFWNCKS